MGYVIIVIIEKVQHRGRTRHLLLLCEKVYIYRTKINFVIIFFNSTI